MRFKNTMARTSNLGPRTLRCIVAATLVAWAAPILSHANPLQLARMGGLKGDPVYDGPFALYWNPAGLARLKGFQGGLHLMAGARQASYDRQVPLVQDRRDVPAIENELNNGEATTGSSGVIPGLALGYGDAWGDFDVGFGLGAYVAQAGVANWDRHPDAPAEYPGAYDGPQRWSTISSGLIYHTLSAGVGVRHRPSGLTLGVAPAFHYVTLALNRARNADRSDHLLDLAGNLKEGRIFFEGDDTGLTWVLGARWDVDDELSFAVAWHTARQFQIEGDARIAFGTAPEAFERASARQPSPHIVRLGSAIQATPWLRVRPTLEWSQWPDFVRQETRAVDDGEILLVIEREFEAALSGKLRADVRLSETLELMLGLGYEDGVTPTRTHEPGLAEGDSLEGGLGLTWAASERVALAASFIYQHFPERRVTNSIQVPSTNGVYTDQRQFLTLDLVLR